jgi:Raf kinase inhibitor-like YbhB/YbcL family protein
MRFWVISLCLLAAACGRDGDGDGGGDAGGGGDTGTGADSGPLPDSGPPDTGAPATFTLTSTAFAEGGMVPLRYECGPPLSKGPGENVSPPLAWTGGPTAGSYAIVMRDRDFMNLVHWVIYDIPAATHDLPEDVNAVYMPLVPDGARQAELQGSGYFGYFGPCSPSSVNTYEWTVHAIADPMLGGVTRDSTEDEIADAVEAASIGSASLSGES